jgi:hypothetical protein
MWKLWVRTYEYQEEGEEPTLVLEHSFFGKTREEALHYSESHSKTDSFYRDTGGHRAASESYRVNGPVLLKGAFRGIRTLTDAEFKKRK